MRNIIVSILLSVIIGGVYAEDVKKFTLTSKSFKNGDMIPVQFTKTDGAKNISPQLSWYNAPAGTKSYIITCIDINTVAKRWVHWMVINIPAKVNSINEGASCSKMPAGVIELFNSFREKGWGGPKPPAGTGIHHYVFTIYALSRPTLRTRKYMLSEAELLHLLRGKVLAEATLAGKYIQK
jgi:Raf kinase inhibitor-like YbhB/YbcL family protein